MKGGCKKLAQERSFYELIPYISFCDFSSFVVMKDFMTVSGELPSYINGSKP